MKALLYAAAAVIPLTLAAAPTPFVASAAAQATVAPADDALFVAVGGRRAFDRAAILKIEADGEAFTISESHLPESGPLTSNTFTSTTLIDLKRDRLRAELDRNVSFNFWEQRPNPRHVYTEIVDGRRGFVSGTDNILGIGDRPMFSDRVASTRKHQRLLNPHLVFADVARGARTATDGGTETIDGQAYKKIVVTDRTAPFVYWINTATGRIDRLTTEESRPDQRDAPLEVRYGRWTSIDGVAVPGEVRVLLSGEILQHEVRRISLVKRAGATDFVVPADAVAKFRAVAETAQGQIIQSWYGTPAAKFEDAVNDPEAERFGETSSQFLNTFTGMGVAFNGHHGLVIPVELAPGAHLILGSSNNSMVVEQDDSVVLIEAPLSPERSKSILAWIKATYPGKPVSKVVVTHYHYDHVAGLRQLINEGATIVSSDLNAKYLASLGDRQSELAPDDQARAPKPAKTDPIPYSGTKTLKSAKNEILLVNAPNRHAADWTYVYLPQCGVLFTGDVHNPPFPPLSSSEFADFLADFSKRNLKVNVSAGGHGATMTGAEFDAAIEAFKKSAPAAQQPGG